MSSEKTVLDYIEARFAEFNDGPKPSRHFYDLSKNDNVKDNFVYAVRPGSSTRVTGTVMNATVDQDFELIVSADYVEKTSGDESLRQAVEIIENFMERLMPVLILNKINPIIQIKIPTKQAPEIDHMNKSVSRTYNLEVTYKISLRGAA